MSVNKVILVGNVGKDPEVRYLENNLAVANFSLATSETYTNKNGERVTQTEWHNIVLWRKLAEIAEKYIVKGKQIYLEGRIRTRSYEDKDGVTKYRTEIYGDQIQLLGRKSDDAAPVAAQEAVTSQVSEPIPAHVQAPPTIADDDDDLPF